MKISQLALIALGLMSIAAEAVEPKIADAFARVQRNGQPYNTFYSHYVAPHAVQENGKIFTAHQDGQGRPIVNVYDLQTKKWSSPVRADDFGLGADTHGNPSILIDGKGYLHLFFGCHGRAMLHSRSVRPYDITQWQRSTSPTPRATYPESMRMADGRLLLFFRAGGHMEPWSVVESSDDGETWSAKKRLVEFRLDPPDRKAATYNAFYPGADGRTVHCFFVHKDDNPTRVNPHPWRPLKYPGLHEAVYRYNVYYIRCDANGDWYAADGTRLTDLPLSKAAADRHARIFDSGDLFASTRRMLVDKNDRPYLRFDIGVTDWKSGKVIVPPTTHFAAPDADGRWVVTDRPGEDWPTDVRQLIVKTGAPVYGTSAPSPWMIYHERGPVEDPRATYVWLEHVDDGFARREAGAAASP